MHPVALPLSPKELWINILNFGLAISVAAPVTRIRAMRRVVGARRVSARLTLRIFLIYESILSRAVISSYPFATCSMINVKSILTRRRAVRNFIAWWLESREKDAPAIFCRSKNFKQPARSGHFLVLGRAIPSERSELRGEVTRPSR